MAYDPAVRVKSTPALRRLAKATFPAWRGRKYRIRIADTFTADGTMWSGGSRSQYVAVCLKGGGMASVPQERFLERSDAYHEPQAIPADCVVVEHSYFCGKDMGLTIHCPTPAAQRLLPGPELAALPA